jgi:2-polyprenyl-6-methoxyphenol hydroxylase-like FAD-dependent oxidoreductase
MPTIRANRVDERGAAMIDARGRRLSEMSAEMFGGEGFVAEIEIARGDLARILYEATDCAYRFADKIETLTQDADGVDVTFADQSRDRFDIVVGADGVHSGVRALAFGPESEFVRPLGGYLAYFTVPDPGDLDHWLLMYNAPGGRVAMLRPERGGTAKAMLSFVDRAVRYERLDRAAQERILTERMTGAGWKVPELLAAMPGAGDFYFDSISQVTVDRWARGRVVLLGDAGYCGSPLAGLGTSMSLVGAYVLAGELTAHDRPEAAFAAYQERMAAYVASGMELPPGGLGAYAPRTRLMIRLRAASMRMMVHWPMKALLAKQFGKADAITLADYPALPSSPRPAPERPAGAGSAR